MNITLSIALALVVASPPTTTRPSIVVEVVGARHARGSVVCHLFGATPRFPDVRAALRAESAPITRGRATCVFDGVAAGIYAIAAFHDEDGDGVLQTNFIGIPSEPHGASNGAQGHLGPPALRDAQFTTRGDRHALRIHLER